MDLLGIRIPDHTLRKLQSQGCIRLVVRCKGIKINHPIMQCQVLCIKEDCASFQAIGDAKCVTCKRILLVNVEFGQDFGPSTLFTFVFCE